jgi:hypothetical protein
MISSRVAIGLTVVFYFVSFWVSAQVLPRLLGGPNCNIFCQLAYLDKAAALSLSVAGGASFVLARERKFYSLAATVIIAATMTLILSQLH